MFGVVQRKCYVWCSEDFHSGAVEMCGEVQWGCLVLCSGHVCYCAVMLCGATVPHQRKPPQEGWEIFRPGHAHTGLSEQRLQGKEPVAGEVVRRTLVSKVK